MQLDTTSLPLDSAMTLAYYFIISAYIIYSAIFHYHWSNYSSDKKVSSLTFIIYFSSTLPLAIALTVITFML